jgi:hypothetical protein
MATTVRWRHSGGRIAAGIVASLRRERDATK